MSRRSGALPRLTLQWPLRQVVYISTPRFGFGAKVLVDEFCPCSCAISKLPPHSWWQGVDVSSILGFEVLCDLFAPDSRRVKDFSALYVMRKTKENNSFFTARRDLERLIINLADSDHCWRETVIRVPGAWEAAAQKDLSLIHI